MTEYKEYIELLIPITICIVLITFMQLIKFIDYLIKSNEESKKIIQTKNNQKIKEEIKKELIEYYNKTK